MLLHFVLTILLLFETRVVVVDQKQGMTFIVQRLDA